MMFSISIGGKTSLICFFLTTFHATKHSIFQQTLSKLTLNLCSYTYSTTSLFSDSFSLVPGFFTLLN